MRIGIVGNGVVGNATARCLTSCAEVRVHDVLPEKSSCSLKQALDCDLVMLCLPTPKRARGLAMDLAAVYSLLDDLYDSQANLVLRSTVPIGTTQRLSSIYSLPNLIHWPEFLTARRAVEDAANPRRNLIGCPNLHTLDHAPDVPKGAYALRDLLAARFPATPPVLMRSGESEAIKLIQNAFSAVKVSFFSEVRALVDKLGLSWEVVLAGVLAGGWINPMHTQVPGPDGKRGFGGACLPKDLACLINSILNEDLPADVCEGALNRNAYDRRSKP